MGSFGEHISFNKSAGWLTGAGVAAFAAFTATNLLRRYRRPASDLNGKIALITGGSRGLGLALAKSFGERGAKLALCARDLNELRRACDQLADSGIEAVPFPADLTDAHSITTLIESVLATFGRIDILVNNAGRISVAPFESFTKGDFEEAMTLMFWAPVNLIFAVLPHMRNQASGHIVNISSIGGRVAVPHLLPYTCAKFALVGFSTGLAAEAARDNIRVLTVLPGLMRTGSYLNAEFKGNAKYEFAWFSLLGNLPGFSVAATYAAECISRAVEAERRVCTISLPAKILIACEALAPNFTRAVLEGVNRSLLPASSEAETVRGKELNSHLNSVFRGLTMLGRHAAQQMNQ